ncbi:MAG TPA: alpha/beta hydrolase-fold protein [Bryobacteraceae bacterium]|nr:alpha/beta hydrolase-fold protein [Bryobacteraceae bacterium]
MREPKARPGGRGPVLFLLLLGSLHAQTGASVLSAVSSIDGSQQPYAIYIPSGFEAPRGYGLLISLHAEDTNHRQNLVQVLGIAGRAAIPWAGSGFPPLHDRELIVACPLARGTMGYQGIAEQDVYDVVADVERRYPIDRDRVYLTGISMGGGGALWLAETRPDMWAGVLAMCPDSMPGSEELAANLLNVPVRLYHGELDTIVPVSSSRAWHRRLLDDGVPAMYTEYPETRHNAWTVAYSRGGALDWLAGLRRNRWPERVRFIARSYQYNSAYWVRIDSLTPGVPAEIDARRGSNGEIQVTTKNLDGFTLTAHDAPPPQVTIDGTVVRLKRGAPLWFNKSPGWRQGLATPAAKRAGAEGPIVQALRGRQIYVYGTLGARGDGEIAERRKAAESAADWSTLRAHLQLTFPVKADREVTAADLDSADVILFGTAESNALVARFADRLPMELRPDAADYGLVFVAPIGKHYALVNSGLAWWTGADELPPSGYSWEPAPIRELGRFGDYVLFRGSIAQVVAEGRFDANWKVPAASAGRLTAAGTVRIH